MDLKLKNKKALVTGSSSGIGEGIAKSLAREGVHVMLHGRNEKELDRVKKEIISTGGHAFSVRGELTSDEDAKKIVKETLETLKGIDILVNNAGAYPRKDWLEANSKDWMDLFNANVVSMVRLIQAFLPQMQKQHWGRIIQIASVAGTSPSPHLPIYGVTKAANINMTQSLARELAGSGITVNTISPGPIVTKGLKELITKMAEENNWGSQWDDIEKKVANEVFPTMVGRLGKIEEVGDLAAFLASPIADFIHGVNYHIDGGRKI
jgi:3-oxoacyl-[acyl-carrier protein] reductase